MENGNGFVCGGCGRGGIFHVARWSSGLRSGRRVFPSGTAERLWPMWARAAEGWNATVFLMAQCDGPLVIRKARGGRVGDAPGRSVWAVV